MEESRFEYASSSSFFSLFASLIVFLTKSLCWFYYSSEDVDYAEIVVVRHGETSWNAERKIQVNLTIMEFVSVSLESKLDLEIVNFESLSCI